MHVCANILSAEGYPRLSMLNANYCDDYYCYADTVPVHKQLRCMLKSLFINIHRCMYQLIFFNDDYPFYPMSLKRYTSNMNNYKGDEDNVA